MQGFSTEIKQEKYMHVAYSPLTSMLHYIVQCNQNPNTIPNANAMSRR